MTTGTATNGTYEIFYESMGSNGSPTVLLVCGFTGQLIWWRDAFCRLLVDAGYHVVRYDNRDVGLSTKTPPPAPDLKALRDAVRAGGPVHPPYTLADMADDGMAVLDALGVERAHVAGVSMGGMIVQRMAIDHPDRVASLTSIMSTSGNQYGRATPEAIGALTTPPPAERAANIDQRVSMAGVIGGPLFDPDEEREHAAAAYDRCFHPQGGLYHMAAITAAPDRTAALASVRVPTMVIHGRVDPLIQLDGGEATAGAVPGATLRVYDEMGHDLPRPLWPSYVADLDSVARAAGS